MVFISDYTEPQTFAHINLTISSGNRAGGSQIQTVTVPLAEDALRISLSLPQPAPQGATYRVQWEDIKGPIEDLEIEKPDANPISVIIPRDKLTPGQYLLKLFRKNPSGTEDRVQGSYLFIASNPVLEASREPAPAESQDDIENLTTVAARKEALDEYLKSARELREANELIKAAHALNQAGRLQLKLNLPNDALGTFKDSLTLTDQVSHPATKAEALNGLAATHLYSGKFLDAIPLAHQAITISDDNNYPRGKAEALLILGDCENNTNHTEALKIGNEALTLWQSIGDNIGVIRSHLNIGRYQLAQNSLDDATSSYETARRSLSIVRLQRLWRLKHLLISDLSNTAKALGRRNEITCGTRQSYLMRKLIPSR